MSIRRHALAGLVLGVLAASPSASLAAPPRSPDSRAPRNAPAHWLPPEAWVYNHWLPYDEGRLYRVLRITREQLWAVVVFTAVRGKRASVVAPQRPQSSE